MGKRRTQKHEPTRKSQRNRKETQKYQAFKKMNVQLYDSGTDENVQVATKDLPIANFISEEDLQTLNMLSGEYKLTKSFQLDLNASNGYSNALKEVEADAEVVEEEVVVSEEEENEIKVFKKCTGGEDEERDLIKVIKNITAELERMEGQMNKKDEEMRKMCVEMKQLRAENEQLRNSNLYRKEVMRLEADCEDRDRVRRRLESEVEK